MCTQKHAWAARCVLSFLLLMQVAMQPFEMKNALFPASSQKVATAMLLDDIHGREGLGRRHACPVPPLFPGKRGRDIGMQQRNATNGGQVVEGGRKQKRNALTRTPPGQRSNRPNVCLGVLRICVGRQACFRRSAWKGVGNPRCGKLQTVGVGKCHATCVHA